MTRTAAATEAAEAALTVTVTVTHWPGPVRPGPMRFERHSTSSFSAVGNVKAFNLKKIKLTLSPSPQWPQAAPAAAAASPEPGPPGGDGGSQVPSP